MSPLCRPVNADARRAEPAALMVGVAESTRLLALALAAGVLGRRAADARRAEPAALMVGVAESTPYTAAVPAASPLVAPFGRAEIESIIPHREPFLFVDEVLELEPGSRVVARKLVRDDEWYFAGHFPANPIMPGVIMVEALAQAGAVAALAEPENRGRLALFAGIDDVRFKRIVRPGDELTLSCELETVRGPVGRGVARATVGGELAVRGVLTFAVRDVS